MTRPHVRHALGAATVRVPRALGLLLVVTLAGSSCMSQSEGDALRRDIKRLRDTIAREREAATSARTRLQAVMEQATALTTRNSADVSVQVERLQLTTSQLAGKIEALAQSVDTLRTEFSDHEAKAAKLLASSPATTNVTLPTGKDELFDGGMGKVLSSQHEEGRRLLRHFLARYPNDPRGPEAQLALGNSYYAQQKLAPAIQEYRKVIERHKGSKQVPEALYKVGMSFYQLKYCSDAKNFFEELIKRYRDSQYGGQANKVLQRIRRYRRDRRICTS